MTDLTHSHAADMPHESPAEVRSHRESFHSFMKFATFAVMHVALMLVCLALGFPGNAPVFAVLLGIFGTLAMVVALLVVD